MSTFGTLVVLSEPSAQDIQLGTRTVTPAKRADGVRAVLSRLAPDTVLRIDPGTTEHFIESALSQLRRLPRETVSIQVKEDPHGQSREHLISVVNDLYRGEVVPRLLNGQTILLITSQHHARALSELFGDDADTPQPVLASLERCAEYTFDRYLAPTKRRSLNVHSRHGRGKENQQA